MLHIAILLFSTFCATCADKKNSTTPVNKQSASSKRSIQKSSAPSQKTAPHSVAKASQARVKPPTPQEKITQSMMLLSQKIHTSVPYAFLIDAHTGTVLFAKNSDQRMIPSSMTKIMTLYMVFKALKNREIDAQDMVVVSRHAAKQEGSRMFLIPEKSVSVTDLIKGISVVSGNDACTAIAEFMSGTEKQFAENMTEEAKKMGAQHTRFMNASGLPDKNHYTTCRDLALITQKLINDFPEWYQSYFSMGSFTFNGINQPNRNRLLGYVDGVKTGRTDLGKYGIVLSRQEGKRRLIAVLNGAETDAERTREGKRLLQWGFNQTVSLVFLEKNEPLINILLNDDESIALVSHEPIVLCIPKSWLGGCRVFVRYTHPIRKPVDTDTPIATLEIHIPECGKLFYPLYANKSLPAQGIFKKIKQLFSFSHRS